MDKMLASVWYGPNQLRVEEIPVPSITEHECLLKVAYCGLCKTDIKKIKGMVLKTKGVLEPPRVFGHEIVGTLVKVGKQVKNWKEGDRIAIYHHVPCGECYYCTRLLFSQCETYRRTDTSSGIGAPSGGGFGQFVKIPELIVKKGMIKILDSVDFETAVFMEPTNCCLKGVSKADIQLNDYVAVIGQGPIGVTINQLVKLKGAKVFAIDLVDYRLKKAKEIFGADYSLNARREDSVKKIKELTDGISVDISIVAVEEPAAISQAIKYTRRGGKIVFFSEFSAEEGLTEEERRLGQEIVNGIYGKELTVIGSYSSSYLHHELAAEFVFSGKINNKDQISHIGSLYDLQKLVDLASRRRPTPWKAGSEEEISEEPPPEEQSFKILIKP